MAYEPSAGEIRAALEEDLGEDGDVTTRAVAAADVTVTGVIVAKAPAVVAGLTEARLAFTERGAGTKRRAADGDAVEAGARVLDVWGPALAVLSAERVALNYLMRMSGIATVTARLQAAVSAVNPACRVAATRKTTPGFRRAEKRAVVLGGGDPHRFGLFDAFLVKDNHRALRANVADVVQRCRALDPGKRVQVEVESLEDALAAAGAGADALLLDNLDADTFAAWARDVRAAHPGVLLEASGGLTPGSVAAYAPHADRVSLGWITHSAPAIDYSLEVTVDAS